MGLIPPLPVANSSDAPSPPTTNTLSPTSEKLSAVGVEELDPCVLVTGIDVSSSPTALSHHEQPMLGVLDDDVSEITTSLVETVGTSEVSSGTVVNGPRRLSPVVVADAASL